VFRACELVVVNKIDLLPHLDYDVDRPEATIAQVNPDAATMRVSARTGEGVDASVSRSSRYRHATRPRSQRARVERSSQGHRGELPSHVLETSGGDGAYRRPRCRTAMT
jgi:G3E family GTPase